MNFYSHKTIIAAISTGIALFFWQCKEEKVSTIDVKADLSKIPTTEMFKSEIIQTDSGRAFMKINAPIIQKFEFDPQGVYTLLPKGGKVLRYEKPNEKPIFVRANWAKLDDTKRLYEGKGKVLMISKEGDTVKTEQVFWDMNTKKIYSKLETHIIRQNKDSMIAKKGFESDDAFKNVKIFNTRTISRNSKLE